MTSVFEKKHTGLYLTNLYLMLMFILFTLFSAVFVKESLFLVYAKIEVPENWHDHAFIATVTNADHTFALI